MAGLLRSHAEILRSLHDLGVGEHGERVTAPAHQTPNVIPGVPEPRQSATPAFDIAGVKTDGAARRIAVVETDHTTLLAFLSTGCSTCTSFWKAFREPTDSTCPGSTPASWWSPRVPGEESESRLRDLAPRQFPLVMSSEAWTDYQVPVSPYFILVDGPAGRVLGEGAAATWAQVKNLLTQAVADQSIVTRTPVPGDLLGSRPRRPHRPRTSRRRNRARACQPLSGRRTDVEERNEPPRSRRSARRRHAPRCPVELVTVRRIDAVEHHAAR